MIDWSDTGWQVMEHSLSPDPYAISKIVQSEDGERLDIWITYWHGEKPCLLTEEFRSNYFLHDWNVRLTIEIGSNGFVLNERQVLSWELRKDGELYKLTSDWQHYCVGMPSVSTEKAGQLLKSDGPAVYLLTEQGFLRHIPTWADFVALGYEDDEITTLTEVEICLLYTSPSPRDS